MDLKLSILLLFMGTIISLSHQGDKTLVKMKRKFGSLHWGNPVLVMLRSVKTSIKI